MRVFPGIQIFFDTDHADHREKHEKCLSAETEAEGGKQQKSHVVLQSIPQGISGGGQRKQKQGAGTRHRSHGGELEFRDV